MWNKGSVLTIYLVLGGLVACKSGQSTVSGSQAKFQEDLAAYRPRFAPVAKPNGQPTPQVVVAAPSAKPTGDIGGELGRLRAEIAEANKNLRFAQGYWVQVYSGSSREEANRIMTNLRYALSDEKPELVYSQPNYKVKVGNFFHKYDAYQLYAELKGQYPNAFIASGRISIELDKYRN
jgi:hypothetical protein